MDNDNCVKIAEVSLRLKLFALYHSGNGYLIKPDCGTCAKIIVLVKGWKSLASDHSSCGKKVGCKVAVIGIGCYAEFADIASIKALKSLDLGQSGCG